MTSGTLEFAGGTAITFDATSGLDISAAFVTFPPAVVRLNATQTLTNKTLTAPILTTPALGVATATSINGLTITTSTGTLTIANGKTATVNNSLTLAGTDSTTMTFPSASGTVVTIAATQTLTNKTINGPDNTLTNIDWGSITSTPTSCAGYGIVGGASLDNMAANWGLTPGKTGHLSNSLTFAGTDGTTMTFPSTSGNVVTEDSTANLTSKTFNGLNITTSSGTLSIASGKTITFQNQITFAGTDGTTFTFPAAGDGVAGVTATQTLTHKTLTSPTITPGSAPGSPTEGMIYYDSTTHHFLGWTGSAWQQLDN